MHPLLDNYLCKKYPKIFVNRNKPMTETCMCWGFPGDGWFYIIDSLCHNIQHWCDNPQYVLNKSLSARLGRLWNKTAWNWFIYPLVKGLPFEEYQRYSKQFRWDGPEYVEPEINPRSQVTADQVKEKFSGLRFYYSGGCDKSVGWEHGGDYIRGLVDMASSMSYHTCECCGRTDDEVVATKGWIVTTCPDCKRSDQLTQPRNSADPELAKIWKQIHKEDEENLKKQKVEAGKRRKKSGNTGG
jgi:glutaredoxin